MSFWTHIVATIDCDTYIESDTLVEDVMKILKDAPAITGSEGNAEVFVNQLGGWNRSTSADCAKCEYRETIEHCEEGGFYCYSPEEYVCPDGYYQTRVVITVLGDLRDKMQNKTKKEWEEFVKFVEDMVGYIRNIACNITCY